MLRLDIHKTLGENHISCKAEIESGKITALFGKSGSGKTSILRMIAGLDYPDTGNMTFNGINWCSNNLELPMKGRPVGFVFQDFNLFRHMTVKANLEFANDGELSGELLKLSQKMGIYSLFDRHPKHLSKGQQQKVAILRSLCLENEILLLDEPFSALDDESILEIINILDTLKSEENMTIVLVTHRKDVILRMADSVVNIETGEQGTPNDMIQKTI